MTANQSDTTNDVDCTTLYKKLMMGYQGWFGYAGDGSKLDCCWHWSTDNSIPDPSNLIVDMWPDTSDFAENDKFQTNLSDSNGPASLYSAYSSSVVDLHFKWMNQYQLDGVMLQRFVSELGDGNAMLFRDRVTSNVESSAKTYGRAFCIMYDITGYNGVSLVDDITKDWNHLVNDLKITNNTQYLNHKGNPLLAIWGLGFSNGPIPPDTSDPYPATPTDALNLINYFKNNKVTILGGVPYKWRTLEEPDSKPDPAWANVYRSFDVISPWSVGRYYANNGNAIQTIDAIQMNTIKDDLKDLLGIVPRVEYMPVVFPGYSHYNTEHDNNPAEILNRIKRYGGKFWWRQVYNAVDIAQCTMIYGAMFDEVNEGTAMFKLVADQKDLPTQAELVPVNVPDESPGNLKSDYYLWLAGETNRRLRDGIKFTSNMPTLDQTTPLPNWF